MNVVGSSKMERKGILKSLLGKLPGGVGFPLSPYERAFSLSVTVGERPGKGCHKQALQLYKQATGKIRHLLVFIKLGVWSLFLCLPKALPGGELQQCLTENPGWQHLLHSLADYSWPWAWLANFLDRVGFSQIGPSNPGPLLLSQRHWVLECVTGIPAFLCVREKGGSITGFLESKEPNLQSWFFRTLWSFTFMISNFFSSHILFGVLSSAPPYPHYWQIPLF